MLVISSSLTCLLPEITEKFHSLRTQKASTRKEKVVSCILQMQESRPFAANKYISVQSQEWQLGTEKKRNELHCTFCSWLRFYSELHKECNARLVEQQRHFKAWIICISPSPLVYQPKSELPSGLSNRQIELFCTGLSLLTKTNQHYLFTNMAIAKPAMQTFVTITIWVLCSDFLSDLNCVLLILSTISEEWFFPSTKKNFIRQNNTQQHQIIQNNQWCLWNPFAFVVKQCINNFFCKSTKKLSFFTWAFWYLCPIACDLTCDWYPVSFKTWKEDLAARIVGSFIFCCCPLQECRTTWFWT